MGIFTLRAVPAKNWKSRYYKKHPTMTSTTLFTAASKAKRCLILKQITTCRGMIVWVYLLEFRGT